MLLWEPLCNSHETNGKIKILQRPNTKDSSIQWQIPVIDFIYIFNKFLNWTNSALKFNTLSLFVGIQCCLREFVVYYTCLSLKFFLLKCFTFERKKISDFGESLVLIPTFSHLLQTWSYLYFTGNKTPRPQRKRTDRRNAGRVFQDKDIYRNCKLLDYLCMYKDFLNTEISNNRYWKDWGTFK